MPRTSSGDASPRAARQYLGWQPRYPIAEGIRHSLDWAAIRDGILSG